MKKWLICIISFLLLSSNSFANRYVVFSLKRAKERLLKNDPIAYNFGNITDIKAVVYNRKESDFLIIGIQDPALPRICIDDFVIALRSVFIYGRSPSIKLIPDKDKKKLLVIFRGGIKDTSLGKELLDRSLYLLHIRKKDFMLVCVVPRLMKNKDIMVIDGFESIVITDKNSKQFLKSRDLSFLRLKTITKLVAISQAIELMDVDKDELWFWLNGYRLRREKTPEKLDLGSKISCEIDIMGRTFFEQVKWIKKLKKQALKNEPENECLWHFSLKREKKAGPIDTKKKSALSLFFNALFSAELKKNYYAAIDTLTKTVKIFPKWDLPYYMRGCVKNELGHYQDAIKDYEEAIKLNPKNFMAHINKACSYNYLGMHKKALKELNKVIQMSPYHIDAYNNRGIAFCGIGKYEKGISDFENIIRISPQLSLAYVNIGKAYFCLGDYNTAIKHLNKAISISPKLAEAYCNRGIAYRYIGQYRKAIKDFNKAIEIRPYYAYAYLQRGLTYEGFCEWSKADKDIEKATRLDPKIFSMYIFSVIRLSPRTAVEYYERGHAYFCIGHWKKAIEDFNMAIKMKPDFASAYFYRGLSYDNLKEYRKAIEDYTKAIRLFPNDAIMYNNRGTAYYSCKEYKKALMDFNKAIEIDPHNAVFYENRVRVYSRLGKNKEACRDAKLACKLGRCRLLRLLSEKGICR